MCCSSKKPAIFSFIILLGIWIIFANFSFHLRTSQSRNSRIYTFQIKYKDQVQVAQQVTYSRSDQQCILPEVPIWPEYFRRWKPRSRPVLNCAYEENLAALNGTELLKLPLETDSTCCLHEVLRGANDSEFSITECKPFISTQEVNDMESIIVKCGNYVNVEANIPMKRSVQEKIDYWAGFAEEERPYSVYILGFDTVSRSHAYRSLPKSTMWLKLLDFVDFKGFHSTAPSTLPSFMAMLMGLTRTEVRDGCSKDWASPFDSCPLIWKNFSDNNYVTGYIEDGEQSFNWGGQAGFMNQPTDYYLHHLFIHLRKLRDELGETRNLSQRYSKQCASKETIPEFLLRYHKRWLSKFQVTPFFYINWFAYPFHDDINALSSFDKALAEFLAYLSMQPNLLEKTLIIFLSDHGDRTSKFFSGKSIESFFERSLPALFIRLPDRLRREYPNITETLKENALQLTTHFDLHHSMLHLMSLNSNMDLVSETFRLQASDRSSLFVKLPPNRNCESTNISPTCCLCNLQWNETVAGSDVPTSFTMEMMRFAVDSLNKQIVNHGFRDICSNWRASKRDFSYARYVGQTGSQDEAIISFVANPGKAKFEARFKIRKNSSNNVLPEITEIVGLSRISKYGDQSWCLPTLTEEDKGMKEFCACKIPRA